VPNPERLHVTGEGWLRLVRDFSRLFRRCAGTPTSLRRDADISGRRGGPGAQSPEPAGRSREPRRAMTITAPLGEKERCRRAPRSHERALHARWNRHGIEQTALGSLGVVCQFGTLFQKCNLERLAHFLTY